MINPIVQLLSRQLRNVGEKKIKISFIIVGPLKMPKIQFKLILLTLLAHIYRSTARCVYFKMKVFKYTTCVNVIQKNFFIMSFIDLKGILILVFTYKLMPLIQFHVIMCIQNYFFNLYYLSINPCPLSHETDNCQNIALVRK